MIKLRFGMENGKKQVPARSEISSNGRLDGAVTFG